MDFTNYLHGAESSLRS